MKNELFVKGFAPGAAITKCRIVKVGAADEVMIQATADVGCGIANEQGALATDDTVDVVLSGIAKVEYGGTVTRGAYLTSDANGKAVVADTEGQEVIARALAAGVVGDIVGVLITPFVLAVSGSA